jgi:endonuclease/exonuclease/phosphatase family metal-dependent hydrolase
MRASCVLAPFAVACGQPPLTPRPPSDGAPHFTLMSYNIELGAAGEQATLDSIGLLDADVVALQEVTHEAEAWLRAAHAERYPNQLYKSKGGAGGLAVLSRFPLSDRGLRPDPRGWHPSWHLEVQSPAGPVQLLNVHLRSLFGAGPDPLRAYLRSDEDHLDQIRVFSDVCEGDVPTIVLGDFNEGVEGRAIRFLEDRGFSNLLPAYHPGQPTWGFRSVGNQLGETLDHILISDHLVPLDAWVKPLGKSDHLPVLAHVEPRSW